MPIDPPRETSLDAPVRIDNLDEEELSALDVHWRAANYLAVGHRSTSCPTRC